MLLGFISLLLTVFQDRIAKICISEDLANQWLPCKEKKEVTTEHFQTLFSSFLPNGNGRRLLAEPADFTAYCTTKVPLYCNSFGTWNHVLEEYMTQQQICWNLNPGESSIVIHYGIASSTYIHLRASCCTCDFQCSNHCFWEHKGMFPPFSLPCIMLLLLSIAFWYIWWSRSINGKIGKIMLRIWKMILREVMNNC